jgi:hypothetical protein
VWDYPPFRGVRSSRRGDSTRYSKRACPLWWHRHPFVPWARGPSRPTRAAGPSGPCAESASRSVGHPNRDIPSIGHGRHDPPRPPIVTHLRNSREIAEHYRFTEEIPAVSRDFFRVVVNFRKPEGPARRLPRPAGQVGLAGQVGRQGRIGAEEPGARKTAGAGQGPGEGQGRKWSQPAAPVCGEPSTVTPRPGRTEPMGFQRGGNSTSAGNVATRAWSSPPVRMKVSSAVSPQ